MFSNVLMIELKKFISCSQVGKLNSISHEVRLSAAAKRAPSLGL